MAFIRFLIVGGLGFVIDSGMTLVLIHLGLSAFIARLPAILLAMIFTWLANRRLTFRLETRTTSEEAMRYFAVATGMACLNYLLYSALIVLKVPAFIAITFATAAQTLLSFFSYKKLVFKQPDENTMLQKSELMSSTDSHKFYRISLWTVAFGLFIINFVLKYPGTLSPDSTNQYAQALSGEYSDWHPPIMAWVWSWFLRIADGPSTMLALHLSLHWLGFALIADGLLSLEKPRSAWIALTAGAFPVFWFYNGMIMKDIGMASTMLFAFGLGFRYRITGRPIPWLILFLAAISLAYGTLVRTNAIFAFGPLAIYLFTSRIRFSGFLPIALISILLAGLALPVSNFINRELLGAKSDGAIQSLVLFDLNGIAYHSKDLSVLPPEFEFSYQDLQNCYTPYWWDTLSKWGSCSFAWNRLGPDDSDVRKNLGHRLLSEISKHPMSYVVHRLKAINSMLYFLVPAKHCRYAPGCEPTDAITGKPSPITNKDIRNDYFKKSFAAWPISWLVFGIVLLLLINRIKNPEIVSASRNLLISGGAVLLSMSVIGVGSDIRYAYWSIMTILLAAIISFDDLKQRYRFSDPFVVGGGIVLLLTIIAGMSARLFNFTALI